MIYTKVTCYFAFLFLLSCNFAQEKKKNEKYHSRDMHIRVQKDIPRMPNGKLDILYLLKEQSEKVAGFESLENGFDSLKIRFWFGYSFSEKEQVIEMELINKEWHGSLYDLTNHYTKDLDSIISVTKTTNKVMPKSGWPIFVDSLVKLDILTLPSFHKIPGYSIPTDGSDVSIEIATKNSYRIYYYTSPSVNQGIPEVQKILKIIDLLQSELSFRLLRRI